ncbi:MAG: DUF5069 domain-containing protein [Vulcanimicrobiaceae bacterium]
MSWTPRSGRDSVEEVVWLPRLLQKARRLADFRESGRLIDGYCYGRNDFIDKQVLAFLRTDDVTVSNLVQEHPSDAELAKIIVESSGRTPQERRAFSHRLRRRCFNFALLEADEGRMAPGPLRAVLRIAYNGLMMPAVYAWFRGAEKRRAQGPGAWATATPPRDRARAQR